MRISKEASDADQIGLTNKLKIHRKRLHDMFSQMEALPVENWDAIRPEAIKIYDEALIALQ